MRPINLRSKCSISRINGWLSLREWKVGILVNSRTKTISVKLLHLAQVRINSCSVCVCIKDIEVNFSTNKQLFAYHSIAIYASATVLEKILFGARLIGERFDLVARKSPGLRSIKSKVTLLKATAHWRRLRARDISQGSHIDSRTNGD